MYPLSLYTFCSKLFSIPCAQVIIVEVRLNLFEEINFTNKKCPIHRKGHFNGLTQLKLNYFLCFLIKNLSSIDIVKLTSAPIVANKTVLKTSSECKFGTTLKNVPPAVPIKVGLLDGISIIVDGGNLTNSRQYTTGNSQITSY